MCIALKFQADPHSMRSSNRCRRTTFIESSSATNPHIAGYLERAVSLIDMVFKVTGFYPVCIIHNNNVY